MPLFILSVTYSIVGILLWTRTSPGNADQARDLQQLRTKRKVSVDLCVIHIVNFVCFVITFDDSMLFNMADS